MKQMGKQPMGCAGDWLCWPSSPFLCISYFLKGGRNRNRNVGLRYLNQLRRHLRFPLCLPRIRLHIQPVQDAVLPQLRPSGPGYL